MSNGGILTAETLSARVLRHARRLAAPTQNTKSGQLIFASVWLVCVFVVAGLPLSTRAQTIEWIRQFGSSAADRVRGLAVDSSGVYAGGATIGTLPGQTSAGQYDAFARKYDPQGNERWTRQFGSPVSAVDGAARVAVDATGVYVVGYTEGVLPGLERDGWWSAFLRKYDTAGNELWTRQFSSIGSDPHVNGVGVAVDATGVYVVGCVDGLLPEQTSAGNTDAFVRKYDTHAVAHALSSVTSQDAYGWLCHCGCFRKQLLAQQL